MEKIDLRGGKNRKKFIYKILTVVFVPDPRRVAVFLEQAGVEISAASKLGEVGRSCQVQIVASSKISRARKSGECTCCSLSPEPERFSLDRIEVLYLNPPPPPPTPSRRPP